MAIDSLELKTKILGLLSNQIGNYQFHADIIAPACSILPDAEASYNYPPPGCHVTGLEVIIIALAPEIKHLLGNGIQKKYCSVITLKQWDSSKNLLSAIEDLVNGLSVDFFISKITTSTPNDKLLTIEQAKIQLVEFDCESGEL